MKILWSPRANQDLHRIVDLIAEDKPQAALRWAQTVYKKVSRLKRFPYSGRLVPYAARQDLREIIVGSYRVIYVVKGKTLSILTVFHGAKEFGQSLRKKEKPALVTSRVKGVTGLVKSAKPDEELFFEALKQKYR